jgi:predicted chitinase
MFPSFATTGDHEARLREAAAYFANIAHETDGLRTVVEADPANYDNYCDMSVPYGCPAGHAAYFGRGPVQLSWNYNYHAAGLALGLDLLADPGLVQRDEGVAWKTALWFWNTQAAGTSSTAHSAILGRGGFGETIRIINGALECDGQNPAEVQDRVDAYQRITTLLGVAPGENLRC